MSRKRAQIKPSARAHRLDEPVLRATTPRLLTLKAAAEALGLSVWGLRERIWAGQIPVVQFKLPDGSWARKQYIDRLDIEDFIETHKRRIT